MPDTVGLFSPQSAQSLALPALAIPRVSAGRIVAGKAGWQSSPFIDVITGAANVYVRPPVVLVVAEARAGWFTPRKFTAPTVSIALPLIELPPAVQISVPTVAVPSVVEIPPFSFPSATVSAISIPSVNLPSVSITIPTVNIPRTTLSASEFDGWMQQNLWPLRLADDWGLLNWARDGIRVALSNLLYRLWTSFVQKQIDQVASAAQAAINASLGNVQSQVNDALATARNNIQAAVNSIVQGANAKLTDLTGSANVALKTITTNANKALADFRTNVNAAIAQIPSSVQGALNTFRSNTETGVNNAFKSNRDKLQNALDSYRMSIQNQVNVGLLQITGFATDALNSIVPTLWATLGLPEQQLIVPVLYKSRLDGFDFHAPVVGAVIHYAAFGQ